MHENKLDEVLKTTGIKDVRFYPSIGSTNEEALSWADAGASDLCLVIAEAQTKGKGRFNRRWIAAPGSSLAFSLILKPTHSEILKLPLFAPLCGLAVHDTICSLLDVNSEIKWPNDILINRKKCCGILVEAAWSGDQVNAVVLGIGINISPASIPLSDTLLFPASCLEECVGKEVDRFFVLQEVLRQIIRWRPLLGTQQFFTQWQKHLAFKGEQVMIVESEKQSIIGIEKGINHQGNLILILDNKKEMAFEVGDLHLRPLVASSDIGGINHA